MKRCILLNKRPSNSIFHFVFTLDDIAQNLNILKEKTARCEVLHSELKATQGEKIKHIIDRLLIANQKIYRMWSKKQTDKIRTDGIAITNDQYVRLKVMILEKNSIHKLLLLINNSSVEVNAVKRLLDEKLLQNKTNVSQDNKSI